MNKQETLTPFEQGVCIALVLVGKGLAANPLLDIDDLKREARSVLESMPKEPRWAGGTRGIHQAAMESLLAGFEKAGR